MRTCILSLVAALCTALGGCGSGEPPYPAAIMVRDDGLIGEWRAESEPGEPGERWSEVRVIVEFRRVPLKDGKLHAGGLNNDGVLPPDTKGDHLRDAYVVKLKSEDAKIDLTLLGVLFEKEGRRFVGLQVPPSRLQGLGLM